MTTVIMVDRVTNEIRQVKIKKKGLGPIELAYEATLLSPPGHYMVTVNKRGVAINIPTTRYLEKYQQ